MAFALPDPYREAIRGALAVTYSAVAKLGSTTLVSDLRPTGGSITDTTKPGVRRTLNMDLPPTPGLFNLLNPVGVQLTVTASVTYLDRSTVAIPMGVFIVDSEKSSEGAGGLSVVAADKWSRVQRARFAQPKQSQAGILVVEQIAILLREAVDADQPVIVTATSLQTVGVLTWEKDRDKAIIDLADQIGAWVYFDRLGRATIADIPKVGESADWLVDASASGVLTELDRSRDRSDASNVVVVESSASDGALFPTQFVWDNDPASPTYAGPDPVNTPELAGPFGVVPYFFDTPVLSSASAALAAGGTILAREMGLASQVSLGQVANPAVDAFDVLDVLPPRERYDIPRVLERHVADTVTHPLSSSEQRIEGRSTRAAVYSP